MLNIEALRVLCSPDAELMADGARIDMFVAMGHQAADEIEMLRARVGQDHTTIRNAALEEAAQAAERRGSLAGDIRALKAL